MNNPYENAVNTAYAKITTQAFGKAWPDAITALHTIVPNQCPLADKSLLVTHQAIQQGLNDNAAIATLLVYYRAVKHTIAYANLNLSRRIVTNLNVLTLERSLPQEHFYNCIARSSSAALVKLAVMQDYIDSIPNNPTLHTYIKHELTSGTIPLCRHIIATNPEHKPYIQSVQKIFEHYIQKH